LTFLTPVFALLFGNLFLSEVLSPLQWIGVSMTLVSIYLINQRETIAQKLQSVVQKPAMAQNQLLAEETISQSDRVLEGSRSVTLAPLSVNVTESEVEILPR
jgi:hypothetical protein